MPSNHEYYDVKDKCIPVNEKCNYAYVKEKKLKIIGMSKGLLALLKNSKRACGWLVSPALELIAF